MDYIDFINFYLDEQPDWDNEDIAEAIINDFKHKELQNKSTEMIQEMLYTEYNINWNDYPTDAKRGAACFKDTFIDQETGVERNRWVIDREMPLLKNVDDENIRDYVERFIFL